MTPRLGARSGFYDEPTPLTDTSVVVVAALLAPHPIVGAVLTAAVLFGRGRRHAGQPVEDGRTLLVRGAVALVPVSVWSPEPRLWVMALGIALAAAVAGRSAEHQITRRRNHGMGRAERTIVVGSPEDVARHVQQFACHPELGVDPVATAGPDAEPPTTLPHAAAGQLGVLVQTHAAVHVVVVTAGMGPELGAELDLVRDARCRVTVVAPHADTLTAGVEVVDARGIPMLSLPPRPVPEGPSWWLKRTVDWAGAACGLVVLSPLLVAAAIAIKIDDGGPVFYRQTRVGRRGQLFEMWKFRSMVVDADSRKAELAQLNQAAGPFFKMEDDPRVTRVGRYLRRLSVDELPQLLNVLRGEMSLVGPRPCLPEEASTAPELFSRRQRQLPGMTGLWQVAGRSWLPVAEGVRMDRAYLENWSLALDLRILLRTVAVALRNDRRPPVTGTVRPTPLHPLRYATMVERDQLRPGAPVDLSVIVVTHEAAADIASCLSSVLDVPDLVSREVIVVDNASTDGTAEVVASGFAGVRLIRKRRRDGFSTNSNIGATAASGRHLLFLNPDARVRPGALDALVSHLDDHPSVAVTGPVTIFPDGRPQASARAFPAPVQGVVRRTPLRWFFPGTADAHLLPAVPSGSVRDVDWMLGAALTVRGDAFRAVHGFDEGYRLYCEDMDLCRRLRECGWDVQQVAAAVVEHALGELTSKRFLTWRTVWHLRSAARFVRIHGLSPSYGRPAPRPTGLPRPVGVAAVRTAA
jgi:exopolysaccharide biosynthesis polyprenyl glycosylphosphotransferase